MKKNSKAIARDKFLLSEEGKKLTSGSASGQYLQNRIKLAFLAGYEAARKNNNLVNEFIPFYERPWLKFSNSNI